MSAKTEFGILKFVERGGHCYASTHYITGETLAAWSKNQREISKEQLIFFMKELVVQLRQFHKIEGAPKYQYVNPYAFIISKEEQLFLLDIDAEENEQLLKFMQKKVIRERFWPEEQVYSQRGDIRRDMYGVGRTYQYLLATLNTEPGLKRNEQQKFQKIISNCLSKQGKHPYKNCQDILKQLPKQKYNKKSSPKIMLIGILMLCLLLFTLVKLGTAKHSEKKEKIKQTKEVKKAEAIVPDASTQAEDQIELGLAYLLEFKDYERSIVAFSKGAEENPLAEQYLQLTNYLWKGQEETEDGRNQEIRLLLKRIEKLIPDKQRVEYYLSLLEGYKLLDDLSSILEKIRISEYCLSLESWQEREEFDKEQDIRVCLAEAYEQNKQIEEAIAQYNRVLQLEEEQGAKEAIIKKTSVLYEETQNHEKAIETCAKGLELYPNSEELLTLYIQMQCKNPQITDEDLVNVITKTIQEVPDLLQNETFQKVQQEQGIRVEGERVWVEK